eukprot:tig00000317_g24036.t1
MGEPATEAFADCLCAIANSDVDVDEYDYDCQWEARKGCQVDPSSEEFQKYINGEYDDPDLKALIPPADDNGDDTNPSAEELEEFEEEFDFAEATAAADAEAAAADLAA